MIFLLDRTSKIIIINLNKTDSLTNNELTSFINLDLVWNKGIAFGLLSFNQNYYYNLLTIIIIIVTLIVLILMFKSNGLQKYGFLMVFGGSLGNIFDRLYYSSVPDFIDIHFNNFHWFIFNVADIFITIGVLLLIFTEFFKLNNA